MKKNNKIEILFLADDPQTIINWQNALRTIASRFYTNFQELPEKNNLELLLTDWPEERIGDILKLPKWEAGELGLIRIGHDGSGDVFLSEGVSERELKLICQLLKKTVRLKKELNRNERKLRVQTILSLTDHLTGLLNRRALEIELKKIYVTDSSRSASNREDSRIHFLAMIDIDRFKQVNQQDGFLVGDLVLKTLANGFQKTLAQQQVVRLGGDEFVILAESDKTETVQNHLQTLIERLIDFVESQLSRKISLSTGVVTWNHSEQNLSLDDLLKHADLALRNAKQDEDQRIAITNL